MENVSSLIYVNIFNYAVILYLYCMNMLKIFWYMRDIAKPNQIQQPFDLSVEHSDKSVIRLD